MRSLYRELGVEPDADPAQIKAAYRDLAKRSHPDVSAEDVASGERFKEIHEAYSALRNPQARAVHDLMLALQRERSRQRRFTSLATMSAAFFLTVGGSLLLVGWQHSAERLSAQDQGPSATEVTALSASEERRADRQDPQRHGEVARPPAGGADETEQPLSGGKAETLAPTPAMAPRARSEPAAWTTYFSLRFGFRLRYPNDVFTVVAGEGDDDVLLVSDDGRARLRISATRISRATTLRAHRHKIMKQYGGAVFDRTPLSKTWFSLSGRLGEEAFYDRVTCSCDGRALHRWQVTYPPEERAFYEPIIAEVRRSYRRDGEDEDGHCRRNQA